MLLKLLMRGSCVADREPSYGEPSRRNDGSVTGVLGRQSGWYEGSRNVVAWDGLSAISTSLDSLASAVRNAMDILCCGRPPQVPTCWAHIVAMVGYDAEGVV